MNTCKNIGFSILILSLSSFSFAKDGEHHGKFSGETLDTQNQVERMTNKLDLTAEQQPKVQAILESRNAQMKTLHEQAKAMKQEGKDHQAIAETLKPKKEALHTKTQADLKNVLTIEQFTKYQAMKADKQEKMKTMQKKHGHLDAEYGKK